MAILYSTAEDDQTARRLAEAQGLLTLAETAGTLERPCLRPIAVLQDGEGGLAVINLGLDPWPWTGRSELSRPRKTASPHHRHKPLLGLAARAVDVAVETCAAAPTRDSSLVGECEAAGLLIFARALEKMTAGNIPSALAVAYVASEIMAELSWG